MRHTRRHSPRPDSESSTGNLPLPATGSQNPPFNIAGYGDDLALATRPPPPVTYTSAPAYQVAGAPYALQVEGSPSLRVVKEKPYWALPFNTPVDLKNPEDKKYLQHAISSLPLVLRSLFSRRTADPSTEQNLRTALQLLHVNRVINAVRAIGIADDDATASAGLAFLFTVVKWWTKYSPSTTSQLEAALKEDKSLKEHVTSWVVKPEQVERTLQDDDSFCCCTTMSMMSPDYLCYGSTGAVLLLVLWLGLVAGVAIGGNFVPLLPAIIMTVLLPAPVIIAFIFFVIRFQSMHSFAEANERSLQRFLGSVWDLINKNQPDDAMGSVLPTFRSTNPLSRDPDNTFSTTQADTPRFAVGNASASDVFVLELPLGALRDQGAPGAASIHIPRSDLEAGMIVFAARLTETPNASAPGFGEVVYWNKAAATATQVESSSMISHSLDDLLDEATIRDLSEVIRGLRIPDGGRSSKARDVSFKLYTVNVSGCVSLHHVINQDSHQSVQALVFVGRAIVSDVSNDIQLMHGFRDSVLQLLARRSGTNAGAELHQFLQDQMSWSTLFKAAQEVASWREHSVQKLVRQLRDLNYTVDDANAHAKLRCPSQLLGALNTLAFHLKSRRPNLAGQPAAPLFVRMACTSHADHVLFTTTFIGTDEDDYDMAEKMQLMQSMRRSLSGVLLSEDVEESPPSVDGAIAERPQTRQRMLIIVAPCAIHEKGSRLRTAKDLGENERPMAIFVVTADQILRTRLEQNFKKFSVRVFSQESDFIRELDKGYVVNIVIVDDRVPDANAFRRAALRKKDHEGNLRLADDNSEWVMLVTTTTDRMKRGILEPRKQPTRANQGIAVFPVTDTSDFAVAVTRPGEDPALESTARLFRDYVAFLPFNEKVTLDLVERARSIQGFREDHDRSQRANMDADQRFAFDVQDIRVLGTGTFGTVTLSEIAQLKMRLAIKTVDLTDGDKSKRALAERDALQELMDARKRPDSDRGRFVIEMKLPSRPANSGTQRKFFLEYCPKGLSEFINEPGISLVKKSKRIVAIVFQIVSGLSFIHDEKWVHHDIKEDNIRVIFENRAAPPMGTEWSIRILDFSEALKIGAVDNTLVRGTMPHIAPERYGSSVSTPKKDIFALGVTIAKLMNWIPADYESLEEHRFSSWHAETPNRLQKAVGVEADASNQLVLNSGTPMAAKLVDMLNDLRDMVCGCLASDPAQRWDTGFLLSHDLMRRIGNMRDNDTFDEAKTDLDQSWSNDDAA